MVIAYHSIVSAYGFWLPNDPRGSWSDFVGSYELWRVGGRSTKVDDNRSYANAPHDRVLREQAKEHLKYPAVRFTGEQALAIVEGFAVAAQERGYRVYACSILPDHTHLVIARHERPIEKLIAHMKVRALQSLRNHALDPMSGAHTVWAKDAWHVYIDDDLHLRRAIRYVEDNPVKEGMRRQKWSFCRPLDPSR